MSEYIFLVSQVLDNDEGGVLPMGCFRLYKDAETFEDRYRSPDGNTELIIEEIELTEPGEPF